MRKALKKWDVDRYDIVYNLADGGENILDIGCGSGGMLFRLIDKYNNFYGVDISSSRILEGRRIAESKYREFKKKFVFVEADIDRNLDFESNYFDTIICLAVLEHVYDIYALVKEMYRILKPGGYVIIEVPNIAYLKYRIKLLFGILPVTSSEYNWEFIGWDGGHIHYFTLKKLCELFEAVGFKVIEKTGSGFLASLRNWWPSLLTGDIVIKITK